MLLSPSRSVYAEITPPHDLETHVYLESAASSVVLGWLHAGRVCPVLTTGGAVGLTERQAKRPNVAIKRPCIEK